MVKVKVVMLMVIAMVMHQDNESSVNSTAWPSTGIVNTAIPTCICNLIIPLLSVDNSGVLRWQSNLDDHVPEVCEDVSMWKNSSSCAIPPKFETLVSYVS